jgi:putative MATE family efflux protein
MDKGTDLTRGAILPRLIKLSLPIIGTSFIQMAYNLTDVIWLGRLGAATVTAVTTAGFFMWLLYSIFYSTKSGTETLVSQAVGRRDTTGARHIAENALTFSLFGSIVVNVVLFLFAADLLQFFKLDVKVLGEATGYLKIISFALFFGVLNPVLSSIYIGHGNSKIPFIVNSIGLVVNIILDPLLIFGLVFFPPLGAEGAALATVFSNTLVFSIFLVKLKKSGSVLPGIRLPAPLRIEILRRLMKIGFPVACHQVAFCLFSMVIGRIVSSFGTIPLGVQNIGMNIEALSWSTALGFSTALSAFTGQNYGGKRYKRIRTGYFCILGLSGGIGLLATAGFLAFGEEIFSLFAKEAEMVAVGVLYLKILAVSQIFMAVEIATTGGFYGLGRTRTPSVISIVFTGLRIPAAFILVGLTDYGYEGVWWIITMSSVLKGLVAVCLYQLLLKKLFHP